MQVINSISLITYINLAFEFIFQPRAVPLADVFAEP